MLSNLKPRYCHIKHFMMVQSNIDVKLYQTWYINEGIVAMTISFCETCNCDIDRKHNMLEFKPIQDIVTFNICER